MMHVVMDAGGVGECFLPQNVSILCTHMSGSIFHFPRFPDDDATREVVAYHGTSAVVANEIVASQRVIPGTRTWDWFGRGVYFWEEDRIRALEWATDPRLGYGADVAVVRARVRLGTCLNLVDGRFRSIVDEAEAAWEAEMLRQG
jgi:hypothetical protein